MLFLFNREFVDFSCSVFLNKSRVENINNAVAVYVSGKRLILGEGNSFVSSLLNSSRVENVNIAVAVCVAVKNVAALILVNRNRGQAGEAKG